MIRGTIIDTGPLVAFLDSRDRFHSWAVQQFRSLIPPLMTCESVLSEAGHILMRTGGPANGPVTFVKAGALMVSFDLKENIDEVHHLMRKYADIPMSLADACLVRMSEIHIGSSILTLDHDFRIYRKNGRQVIPTIMPRL